MEREGRGRLSSIDLLPEEADHVVAWAAQELAARKKTQTEIYAEFRERLLAVQGETGATFDIPSFSAFNRYSMRKATMLRRMQETQRITEALAEKFDPAAVDDLTVIASQAIKTLVWEIITEAGDAGITPKGAMELANALRAAAAAQGLSTNRRQRVEAEFAARVDEAIDAASQARGLSAETAAEIRRKVLGVAG